MRVMKSHPYRAMSHLAKWMDRYYIDPILGLIPGGWGDTFSALMTLPFLWLSIATVKSVPLTLAIIYNILADMVMGLIPFFVGNILDIFSHSYARNMALVQGFINNDRKIVNEVNRKAWFFAIAIIICILAIVLLIKLAAYLLSLIF